MATIIARGQITVTNDVGALPPVVYSLVPSVTAVRRAATGTLSPSSLSCCVRIDVDGQSEVIGVDSPIDYMGRNLALNSNMGWNSTSYCIAQGSVSQKWVGGDTYTVSLKGAINQGQLLNFFRDSGMYGPGSLQQADGLYSKTFVCPNAYSTDTTGLRFSLYNYPPSTATSASVEWIKIERGSAATAWTPAPEDAAIYCNGTKVTAGAAITVPAAATEMKFELKLNGTVIATTTVPVIADGANGQDGADGKDGTNGTNGTNGKDGAAGYNNAVVYLYQRANSTPAKPTSTLTYTFATKALTGTLGSWSATIPSGTAPLYVTAATASSQTATDTIAAAEWSDPVILAQNGSNGSAGLNSASVFLYQRAATTPAAPTGNVTYTFATGAVSGTTLGNWTAKIPASNGNPCYVTQATAVGSGATDTITSSEWSTVVKLVEDGADGTAGRGITSVTEYYAVSSSSTTAPTTWYTSVQNMTTTNRYLWNYEEILYTDGSKAPSAKKVIGVYGNTGSAGKGITSITNKYLATSAASGVTTATTGWTDAIQQVTATNKYLWNYEIVAYTDGSTVPTTPVIIGMYSKDGAKGDPGNPGSDGRGIASTTVTYQTSTSGTTAPSGAWDSSPTPVAAGQYLWTRTVVTYTDGSSSTMYSVGKMGETGAAGYNSAVIQLYKRSATIPTTLPAATLTYTFASGAFNDATLLNGWSPILPASDAAKTPCYVIQKAVSSQAASVSVSGWAGPTLILQDGKDGVDGTDADAEAALTVARDDIAKKLGYGSYEAMVTAASEGHTLITGGMITTDLINTKILEVQQLIAKNAQGTNRLTANLNGDGAITTYRYDETNKVSVPTAKFDGDGGVVIYKNGTDEEIATQLSGGTVASMSSLFGSGTGSVTIKAPKLASGCASNTTSSTPTYTYSVSDSFSTSTPAQLKGRIAIKCTIKETGQPVLGDKGLYAPSCTIDIYVDGKIVGSRSCGWSPSVQGDFTSYWSGGVGISTMIDANDNHTITCKVTYVLPIMESGWVTFTPSIDISSTSGTELAYNSSMYISRYCANGLALGASSNQYFGVLHNSDAMSLEMRSGSYGLKVDATNGVQQWNDDGKWDSSGLLFGVYGLSAGSYKYKFGIKSKSVSVLRVSKGLYRVYHSIGHTEYTVSVTYEPTTYTHRILPRVKTGTRTATQFDIWVSELDNNNGYDTDLHIMVFGKLKL